MTTSLNISRPLVDSFVHRKIKLLKTRGSGEAKFHIGSAENSGDFDSEPYRVCRRLFYLS